MVEEVRAALPRARARGLPRRRRTGTSCARPASGRRRRAREPAGRAAVRRPDQHPVHERHDRLPEGRDAHPPQHPQQRLLRRRAAAATPRRTGSASRCPSTTASAWSWATSARPRTAPAWSSRRPPSSPPRCSRRCRTSAARASTACRRCSSPSSSIPSFAAFDLTSLRTGIMAGSPCPVEVMRRVIERMHMEDVTICYGMTETSPVSTQTGADDPLERRVGTVGRVHPHVEVKVVDPGTGEHRRARRDGRVLHPRLLRDARLLGRRRSARRRRSTARLDAHGRPRDDGRGGLPARSSAAPRTWSSAAARTCTRARSRSSSTRHPDDLRRPGRRRARPALRRGAVRVR